MTENNKDNSIYDSPDFRPFTNDKIFMNVMRSPKICRALLELILPNEEIGAIRIKRSDNPFVDNSEIDEDADENIDESDAADKDSGQTDALENLSVETQKMLKLEADAHGVRFDAFVESSKLWADIEMQTDNDSKIDNAQDTITPTWIWTFWSKDSLTKTSSQVMSSSFVPLTVLNETSLSIFSVRGMRKKACRLTIYRIQ